MDSGILLKDNLNHNDPHDNSYLKHLGLLNPDNGSMDFPSSNKYSIGNSNIHGMGAMAQQDLPPKTIVGCAIEKNSHPGESGEILDYRITHYLGKWVNHSYEPNAVMEEVDSGYYIITNQLVNKGEEITINYENTPGFIKKPAPNMR